MTGESFPFVKKPKNLHSESELLRLENKNNNYEVKEKSKSFKIKNILIRIVYGDLLEQDADVIVNPGGGVACAIRNKCGYRVQVECDKYLDMIRSEYGGGHMNVSDVMHTQAYNIKASYIIHACGPEWCNYKEKKDCFVALRNTYYNILDHAQKKLNKVESIAIPLISSGIFCVPKKVCYDAAYSGIKKYMDESDPNEIISLKTINLVNLDQKTYTELIDYFSNQLESVHLKEMTIQKNDNAIKDKFSVNIPIVSLPNICCNCGSEGSHYYINDCGCYYCEDCKNNIIQAPVKKCLNPECRYKF